jgi:hypothetical protein
MTASAISRMDPATAPIAIPAFAQVESPLFSFLEDVGLDIGAFDAWFDCVFDVVVDNSADGEVTTGETTPSCNDHVVAL